MSISSLYNTVFKKTVVWTSLLCISCVGITYSMLQEQLCEPLQWFYGLESWPEMICRSKLCSPCLHPYLSQHLTDPSCLGPNCACLPACLHVSLWVHGCLNTTDSCAFACACCMRMHMSVPRCLRTTACICVCLCEVVHEYVSLRSTQGPLSEKRPGHADNAQDPSRSRAELGSHDCSVPMLSGIRPWEGLVINAHIGQTYTHQEHVDQST